MLAATAASPADRTVLYSDQTIYETEWTESIPTGISWLSLLTAQSIPEETEGGADSSCSPVRLHTESSCSTSSVDSCYVVLEIQRPRPADEAEGKTEQAIEDDDDEEEMQEEIEELHFAQTQMYTHHIEPEQLAIPMSIEVRRLSTIFSSITICFRFHQKNMQSNTNKNRSWQWKIVHK